MEENPDSVKFVLMLKKGNKQQFKDLNIPVTENLAANIRDKQVAERAEHEEMKRLVLDYNQRQEEEAFNGERCWITFPENFDHAITDIIS